MALGTESTAGALSGAEDRKNRLAAARGRVAAQFLAERDRWILWLPVALGSGVALYFALPDEPHAATGPASAVLLLAVLLWQRRRIAVFLGLSLALAAAIGFTVAQWHTAQVGTSMLADETRPLRLGATIDRLEIRDGGAMRLVLDDVEGLRESDPMLPEKVRLYLGKGDPNLVPGQRVEFLAMLRPPSPPVAPGAFDFRRHAYFEGLGAVGFVMGGVTVVSDAAVDDGAGSLHARLVSLRHAVTGRILSALDDRQGAVAAALLTGERGAIPESDIEAMRAAGLAHLLAISGLHIGLVAGLVFFAVRMALVLVPGAAFRWPIKKWAAVAALLAAAGYLVLSGATVPTQRAFTMVAILLIAVLLDRSGATMRLVALAAAVVLLITPDSLIGASFQLSFAAVVALVAVYEVIGARMASRRTDRSWWSRAGLYLCGVTLTTLVATAATAPFAVYHFQRFALYGLAANAIAVPAMAFWIMPWGVIALALMPFGLEEPALVAMSWGIEVVLVIAREVAAWPGAIQATGAVPAAALVTIALGGLWLCLWQRRWRFAGLLALPIAGTLWAVQDQPHVIIAADGRLVAVAGEDGHWHVSSLRREGFIRDAWQRRLGGVTWAAWQENGSAAGERLACDRLGCVYRRNDQVVALVLEPEAALDDCGRADVVVALVPLDIWCETRSGVFIGYADLQRHGAHEIRLEAGGPVVTADRLDRPWTRPSLSTGE